MSLTISLTPGEEARLSVAAQKVGLAPADFVARIVQEKLGGVNDEGGDIDRLLKLWQQQGQTPLEPEVPAEVLFAQWAEEDATMTPEEREAEVRLQAEVEKSLLENAHVIELRRLVG